MLVGGVSVVWRANPRGEPYGDGGLQHQRTATGIPRKKLKIIAGGADVIHSSHLQRPTRISKNPEIYEFDCRNIVAWEDSYPILVQKSRSERRRSPPGPSGTNKRRPYRKQKGDGGCIDIPCFRQ